MRFTDCFPQTPNSTLNLNYKGKLHIYKLNRSEFNPLLNGYVSYKYPPERIVSLDPASTEALFRIGAGNKVVATDAFSYRPPEAKKLRKIGSYTHVSLELLDSFKPDLVLTNWEAQKPMSMSLFQKGYPVYAINSAQSISLILHNVIVLGSITGMIEESRRLYLELVKNIKPVEYESRPRVYVEFDLGGPITSGFLTHVADAIWISGGVNSFEFYREPYFEPKPDDILKSEPDIIIYEPKSGDSNPKERFIRSLKVRGLESLEKMPLAITRGDFLAHQGPGFIDDALPWLKETIRLAKP